MQLCFSSCQAAADQIFSYTLKTDMQQSMLWYGRVDAKYAKIKRGKWNLKTQNSNEPVQRDKPNNFIYVPSTRLAAENRQNKT